MMRVLFVFILLFASVWVGVQLYHDPGYVLVGINHWTVETTLWVGVILLIIAFLVLHTVLLLLSHVIQFPKVWHHWTSHRRIQKAQEKTRQGLIEFSEGHWQAAKKHLINALPDAETPLLNYLTAARAAQELGDSKQRDDYLRQAQQSMPEAKIAVELTQAQLQLAHRQWEQALATLRHLQSLAPKHPYVLKLLMHLYEEVRDWQQLLALLPELQRYRVIPEPELNELEARTYLHTVQEFVRQNQEVRLKELIAKMPKSLQNNPAIAREYARYLLSEHQEEKADALLRRVLTKELDDQLIELYAKLQGHNKQLAFVESLVTKYPHSAALRLCLGRLCLANHLWGKARAYFEESISLSATPSAYFALGDLLEQLEEPKEASQAYRKGLLQVLGDVG